MRCFMTEEEKRNSDCVFLFSDFCMLRLKTKERRRRKFTKDIDLLSCWVAQLARAAKLRQRAGRKHYALNSFCLFYKILGSASGIQVYSYKEDD